MDIRHLKLIQVLNRYQTLTKAGETLHLTQSALSHQLKEAEAFFGTSLFNRIGKKMVITQAGSRALEAADRIILELDNAINDITGMVAGDRGRIKISTACYTSYHWLSLFLKEYATRYPGIDIDVIAEATHRPLEYLLQGKLDILIMNRQVEDASVVTQKIFDDELLVLVAPGHPLSSRKVLYPEDLVDHTFLMYTSVDNISRTYNEVFAANNVHPKTVKKIQLTEAIIELVKANFGISILAKWAVKPSLDAGEVVGIRLYKGGFKRSWYVAMLKDKMQPKYIQDFSEGIRRFFPSRLEVIGRGEKRRA